MYKPFFVTVELKNPNMLPNELKRSIEESKAVNQLPEIDSNLIGAIPHSTITDIQYMFDLPDSLLFDLEVVSTLTAYQLIEIVETLAMFFPENDVNLLALSEDISVYEKIKMYQITSIYEDHSFNTLAHESTLKKYFSENPDVTLVFSEAVAEIVDDMLYSLSEELNNQD